MPRVKRPSGKGVHVTGSIRDFTGEPVANRGITISLPFLCTWRGKILTLKQVLGTDKDGNFELWLPPTSELQAVKGETEVPEYFIHCENIGSWEFQVPDGVTVMQIGENKDIGEKHGLSK